MTTSHSAALFRPSIQEEEDEAHWNLAFWAARNIPESELARRPYMDYMNYADEVMVAHRRVPKPNLQPLLDAVGTDPVAQKVGLAKAMVRAAKAYAACSATYPEDKLWMTKYRDKLIALQAGEDQNLTGPIEVIAATDLLDDADAVLFLAPVMSGARP